MKSLPVSYHHTQTLSISPLLDKAIEALAARTERVTGAYESHEDFVRLPFDPSLRAEIETCAAKLFSLKLKYVIVVGIGGSNLGTEAVYRALYGNWNEYAPHTPKLICLDTIEGEYTEDALHAIATHVKRAEEVVVNIVSKSGGTTETALNAALLINAMKGYIPEIDSRIVVTTDYGSPLWALAEAQQWATLPIQKVIGGRFSVFTAVGLFPLRLLGIDIDQFRDGGKDAMKHATGKDLHNHAKKTAEAVYHAAHNGVNIWNFFFFAPQLEVLGKWARQLIGESLGKEKDLTGKVVRNGITPIVSIGSTDLHSMAQLYFGGPKDKFTTIVSLEHKNKLVVPANDPFLRLIQVDHALSPAQALSAIKKGVLAAYDKHQLPYQHIELSHGNAYEIGMMIAWLECTIYYLSILMHVNAFDQPNVEDYKIVTKRAL